MDAQLHSSGQGKPGNNSKDEWMLAEEIPGMPLFTSIIGMFSCANLLENSIGANYAKVLGIHEQGKFSFYYGRKDCLAVAQKTAEKLWSQPDFGRQVNQRVVELADQVEAQSLSVPADACKMSDDQLFEAICNHFELHTRLLSWGWVPNSADAYYPEFTTRLTAYLKQQFKAAFKREPCDVELNKAFVVLTVPQEKSIDATEHEQFLNIAVNAQKRGEEIVLAGQHAKQGGVLLDAFGAQTRSELEAHAKKYGAGAAMWGGSEFKADDYAVHLAEVLQASESPQAILAKLARQDKDNAQKRRELARELGIDLAHDALFSLYGQFMTVKAYRKHKAVSALYRLGRIFTEIAKRSGVPQSQIMLFTLGELEKVLREKQFDEQELARRQKLAVLFLEKGRLEVYSGKQAAELARQALEQAGIAGGEVKQPVPENFVLRGQCACPGKAKGRAKIILSTADLGKMQSGDVLVAISTNPDVVPAMRKASAIVADAGGVTSHAAIVSRELGVPCVIGVKNATRLLKDGDLVKVDADKGIVRKLAANK